jgi:hypothetical protein
LSKRAIIYATGSDNILYGEPISQYKIPEIPKGAPIAGKLPGKINDFTSVFV